MRRVFLIVITLLILVLAAKTMADTLELIGPKQPVGQGEVVRIVLKGATDGTEVIGFWRGQTLEFFRILTVEQYSLMSFGFLHVAALTVSRQVSR